MYFSHAPWWQCTWHCRLATHIQCLSESVNNFNVLTWQHTYNSMYTLWSEIILCYCLDPTLTLPNLTTLLQKVNWYRIGRRIGISQATHDMIRNSIGDGYQQRCKCWEVYLNEHPTPSWKDVAEALYSEDYLEELEVIQKNYLKGQYRAMIIVAYVVIYWCVYLACIVDFVLMVHKSFLLLRLLYRFLICMYI